MKCRGAVDPEQKRRFLLPGWDEEPPHRNPFDIPKLCVLKSYFRRFPYFYCNGRLLFKEGTTLQLVFEDGKTKQYDMAVLFDKHPQLTSLRDRSLFLSGRLMGSYGIVWNDDLDIEAETIYEEGVTVD